MSDLLNKIIEGRTDLVAEYLAGGYSATASDAHGTSLIKWCAYHGDVSAIRLLVKKGVAITDLGDDHGINAAAFHGHWQLCQFLLENGADANHAMPDTAETPLHAALCRANRPIYEQVVAVLLDYGANPNATTRAGTETGAFMRDCRCRGETPLHRAAAFGTETTVRLLLAAGASRESKDANGDSPLSWASWHLRPAAILRMLCYGNFSIHPDNHANYDHGRGWGQMDDAMRGKALLKK